MRVGFVSRRYFPAISGMSVYAQNLLQQLVASGHDVTMISQYRGDETGTRIYGGGPPPPVPGVRVIGLEARGEQDGGKFERDIDELVTTIEREHARAPFEVLHAQYGYPTGYAALEASRRIGVPTVVSIQGGDGHWVGSCCATHRDAMCVVLAHANEILIGGDSFADEVAGRLGVDSDRWTIVPGAVDTQRFAPHPAEPPEIVAGRRVLRLLYHGRVDRRKGILDLLDALERMREPARLVVSGIGPDLQEAQERAAGNQRVSFTGYADYDRAPSVYRLGEVFASPTYAEGFSNTILEAMACGLPVVSTRSVGVVDCLRDGDNGLLVEPGDIDAFATAMDRLAVDGALRDQLATRALDEVRATYSWSAVGEQIVAAYERVRGHAPDDSWRVLAGPEPCRFRAEPHLL